MIVPRKRLRTRRGGSGVVDGWGRSRRPGGRFSSLPKKHPIIPKHLGMKISGIHPKIPLIPKMLLKRPYKKPICESIAPAPMGGLLWLNKTWY
ncbi:MAG TPA: hypothetical protein DCK85_12460 [Ktedonobacter sp.]|jgi:hypothetical protein|nr:hypothetical protein [Ktedonobacter sp.]HAT47057.1 hypothetical protein [Ktedonobacter sp.]